MNLFYIKYYIDIYFFILLKYNNKIKFNIIVQHEKCVMLDSS